MSLLGLIEKRSSLANPDSFLLGLFGGRATESGLQVSEQNALTYGAVFSCVNVITEAILTLPMQLYRKRSDGGHDVVNDLAVSALVTTPNEEMAAGSFFATAMGWVLTWGNGYAEIERNNAGEPIALHPLAPNRIRPQRHSTAPFRIEYYQTRAGLVSPYSLEPVSLDATPIDRDNMLHVAGLGFDGIMGYSPIAMAREAIGLGLAAQAYAARFFGNSGIPSGVLESAKPIKFPDKLKKEWQAANGSGSARGTAVLEDGITFKAIGIPPEDSQFLETQKLNRSVIAGIYRVPPHMIGDLQQSTNNNIEHQGMDFVTYCLMGWLCRIEQEMNRKLLTPEQRKAGYFFAFNVDQILRGDMKSRYDAYAVGRQWGFVSADDVRAKERLSALPNGQGKMYLVPMNMVDASKMNEPKPTPAATPADPESPPVPAPATPPADDPARAKKVRATFRALLIDAASRSVRKETEAVRRAARKPSDFAGKVKEFYEGHGDHVRSVLMPVASSLADLEGVPFVTARDAVEKVATEIVVRSVTALAVPMVNVGDLMEQWERERANELADSVLKGIV